MNRNVLVAAIAIAATAAVVVFWPSSDAPEEPTRPVPSNAPPAPPARPAEEREALVPAEPVPAPAVQLPESGRLSVRRDALREGDVLALGLPMPDEVRGDGPRTVKIIDPTGRVLTVSAKPVDGAGTGVRLEIDPEWLEPGTYMIEVKTAEARPLALRRYVLEVEADEVAAEAAPVPETN